MPNNNKNIDPIISRENEYTCGVDEVGRGPLAGAVIAAAVILDPNKPIEGLADSKKLSAKKRASLSVIIKTHALSWAIGRAEASEIDDINILQASLLAMSRAAHALDIQPTEALIDGNRCPQNMPCPAVAHIKGDDKFPCISAASIIAKVYRDNEMITLSKQYPHYGFDIHKGYPTKIHMEALSQHGPCEIHRKTFKPVAQVISHRT